MQQGLTRHSRRRFVKVGFVGVAALQLGVIVRSAVASDLPRVDTEGATAKALSYTHDATTVDADLRMGATRICATCRFYPNESDVWGPCALFAGKAVAARGWCNGWVAKA